METLELLDGKEPFPGRSSLFLAILNERMEELAGKGKPAYFAIRYEMPEFQEAESLLGKEAYRGLRRIAVKTSLGSHECLFVRRSTRSSRDTGSFSHELVLALA
jgi:hypothetical protein